MKKKYIVLIIALFVLFLGVITYSYFNLYNAPPKEPLTTAKATEIVKNEFGIESENLTVTIVKETATEKWIVFNFYDELTLSNGEKKVIPLSGKCTIVTDYKGDWIVWKG